MQDVYHGTDSAYFVKSTPPRFRIFFLLHRVLEFSDPRIIRCKLPKIQTERPEFRVFCQKMQMEWQTVKTQIRLLL